MPPRLSVVMPGVPRRSRNGIPATLLSLLEQAEDRLVEVVYVLDNKKRSVGEKRNACLSLARGDYVAMVDDDDEVAADYIDTLLAATDYGADVITFPIRVTINGGNEGTVESSIFHPINEQYRPGGITKRRPIQNSCWRRALIQDVKFPDIMFGEDFIWSDAACKLAKTQTMFDKAIYHYKFDDRVSEAPVHA